MNTSYRVIGFKTVNSTLALNSAFCNATLCKKVNSIEEAEKLYEQLITSCKYERVVIHKDETILAQ